MFVGEEVKVRACCEKRSEESEEEKKTPTRSVNEEAKQKALCTHKST
jgi:hypothetical protein